MRVFGQLTPFAAPYMQRALLTVLLFAGLAGVVGTVVHLRRLEFVADALTHTIFPGIAVSYYAGRSLYIGALLAALLSMALLALIARNPRLDHDAVTALLIATFFAGGVLVVSARPTFSDDLTALLFGNLLAVSAADLWQIGAVLAASVAVVAVAGRALLWRAFDEAGAQAAGYRIAWLDVVTNGLVALVVVAGARAVGTALVVAFLVVPAALGRLLSARVMGIGLAGMVVVVLCGTAGLTLSWDLSVRRGVALPPGATITVLLLVAFLATAGGARLARRRRRPVR